MAKRIRLGDLLVEKEIITEAQLKDALKKQKDLNLRLGEALLECGYVTDSDIALTLSEQLGYPFLQLNEIDFQPQAVRLVNKALAERYRVVPIAVEGNTLTLAMADPMDLLAMDDIQFMTNMEIKPVILTAQDINRAIEWVYNTPDDSMEGLAGVEMGDSLEEDAPLIRLVNSIIQQAVEDEASDIHIEPDDKHLTIRYRIDGQLELLRELSKQLHMAIVSRIKIMCNMDISERRLPQDGSFRQTFSGREIDFRVSTLPTIRGEKVVLRIHDSGRSKFNLNDIGLEPGTRQHLEKLLYLPYGMLLVTGPTGSGKTTTLYSCLEVLNDPHKNIITIEDPTEYRFDRINQVNINDRIGLTYARVLRSVLRQDPNIVMIGEIRDLDTAEIAVRAALTGHLVLSTLHTNDSASALTRLIDMGVADFLIASSIAGVLAQRLLRRVCLHCRVAYEMRLDSKIAQALNLKQHVKDQDAQVITLYRRGEGCPNCRGTGYRGRIGIFELLRIDENISSMVMEHKPASTIREYAIKHLGMKTLQDDAIMKLVAGITTLDEIMNIVFIEEYERGSFDS